MPEGICSTHGKIEAVWKEGISKAGKEYKFWSCPTREKNPDGTWVRCQVQVANTPTGKFEAELDKAGSQMDQSKKDKTITRIAIAKSMIESGKEYSLETIQACDRWVNWCEGKTPPSV